MRATRALGTVGIVVAVAFGGLSVPAAHADRVKVRGHGYGHGHGMSQYGAQGAARAGKSYRRILARYYPGTRLGSVRGPIRVLITADTSSDVKVSPTRGLSIRDRADDRTWRLPTGRRIDRWRILRNGRIQLHKPAGWRRWAIPGRTKLRGTGAFFANGPIRLWVPSGRGEVGRRYRGALRSARPSARVRNTVNVLSMNRYVRGVVASEMPASWASAALKSQAVAARTYAAYERSQHSKRHYQTCDTTSCQVYRGVAAETAATNRAVWQTGRGILRYRGQPAFTQFSASSGGYTASGGKRYLPARKDPWDDWRGNPVHTWSKTINTATAERRYPSLGRLVSMRVTRRNGLGHWGGRAKRVLLNGRRNNVYISGDDFRWLFGLRSNWFKLR